MAGFQFERDLPHQTAAVEAVQTVLSDIARQAAQEPHQNPRLLFDAPGGLTTLEGNVRALQKLCGVSRPTRARAKPVFDIAMETGTGKTYVYTKTIFELNKAFGLNKFIVAVPRVAIKAGAVSFLRSEGAIEHFGAEYPNKRLNVYEVQSQKKGKSKKERMPQAIIEFCRADAQSAPNDIHVLVINSGMINSPTLEKAFDQTLFDRIGKPYEAIAATHPVLIIDEPHLFDMQGKTYANLQRFEPQFTLRYGATFADKFENLIYQLTAVDAFNQDLVKGITGHVERFDDGNNVSVRLVGLDSKTNEVTFELQEGGSKGTKSTTIKLGKKDRMDAVHPEMRDLTIDSFNQSRLELSNGLELRKGDKINPYSYSDTLQNKMLTQAIKRHFEIERELLTNSPRIKPLSLFFIDNIPAYRDKTGAMREFFEQAVKAHLETLLAKETNKVYRAHLETALRDISALHAGYFSADNSNSDEAIEQETLEILHDKEWLLSLDNPRRFIFSKWTLREGWDNPNIFQICKLRSSGSETSKLQEVGRGLRLPVNEYMARVNDDRHELHYYVDFTESDFIARLTDEINDKSGAAFNPLKLEENLISRLLDAYPRFNKNDDALLEFLSDEGVIKRNNDYKEGGFQKLQELFPEAFSGQVKANKIKSGDQLKAKATIRAGKYDELKHLWERINQKVVLEYRFEDETAFSELFTKYLKEKARFTASGSLTETQRLVVESGRVAYRTETSATEQILPFRMMGYKAFLQELAGRLAISSQCLHAVFNDLRASGGLNINDYLSPVTIRRIRQEFNDFLMTLVVGRFTVGYRKAGKSVHPTKLTDTKGKPYHQIDAVDVGRIQASGSTDNRYLYDEIFFDGDLEKDNIQNPVTEVVVYAKIPRNSLRIPLVGGGTYSPDFAYVVTRSDGKPQLNLIVETKGKIEGDLSDNEKARIAQAAQLFNSVDGEAGIRVQFAKQLQGDKIATIIKAALGQDQ